MQKYYPLLKNRFSIAILLGLVVLVSYTNSQVITSYDSCWSIHIAMSILKKGDTNLDEYKELILPDDYRVEQINQHFYPFFPIGTPLLSVPFVFIADKLSGPLFSIDNLSEYLVEQRPYTDPIVQDIERFSASFIVVLTVILIFLIAQRYLGVNRATLLALVFSFGTSAWSTASRALWQHGPSMFMLTVAVYIILLARDKPSLVQFSSVPLACSYIIRPTNSLSILLLTILVLVQHRRYFLQYCFWASVVAIPFLLHNYSIYGDFLSPYYSPQRVARSSHFSEALIGNLFSPSRGLFIFSPVLLFSIYGGILKVKRRDWNGLDFCLAGIVTLHWIAISSFPHWYGGYSVGPRLFSDVLPYLMILLVPVIAELKISGRFLDLVLTFGFISTVIVSALIHYRCATSLGPVRWNSLPVSVDHQPDRLWDWSDPQFLRGWGTPRLFIAPDSLHTTSRCGENGRAFLWLQNISEKPIDWKATAPLGLSLSSASGTLQGFSKYTVTVNIQTDACDVGTRSIGGIYIDAVSTNGDSVKGSPSVIPVSLHTFEGKHSVYLPLIVGSGTKGKETFASESLFISHPDLLVNGSIQQTDPDQIRAVYGKGWYGRETRGEFSWRWAMSPAEVYIYSPLNQTVKVASVPVRWYEPHGSNEKPAQGAMQVVVNDQLISSVSLEENVPFEIGVKLREGWNVVAFELEAGNFRPIDVDPGSGDSRSLSFAFSSIHITAK